MKNIAEIIILTFTLDFRSQNYRKVISKALEFEKNFKWTNNNFIQFLELYLCT